MAYFAAVSLDPKKYAAATKAELPERTCTEIGTLL